MNRKGRPKLDQRAFEIAGRIQKRREALGLSVAEVARRVNQLTATYRAWERQLGPRCQAMYLDDLSHALSITVGALTGEDTDPATPVDRWLVNLEAVDTPNLAFCIKPKPAKDLPLTHLDSLGQRAKDRRKTLRLGRSVIALTVGINTATLRTWENSISRNISQSNIDAWELALEVPNGWLLNLDVEIPVPAAIEIKISDSLTAADEIRKIGCWIARRHSKKTTDIGQLTQSEARAAEMFALRYGVAGEEASTLQAIGDVFGLTRERVRQIVEKTIERLYFNKIDTPIIDALSNSIFGCLPASVADIDQQFHGQLGESLSIESLERFSREILGKGNFQVTERPSGMTKAWGKVVINPANHNETKLRAIRDAAFEMIRSCGGAQISWVAGTASWQCEAAVSTQDILQACRMIEGFSWLIEEDGWFWFGEATPGDNRVLKLSKKMLAVAGRRLDAEDIQQGLSRARRGYYDPDRSRPVMIEPPLIVVVAILSQVSWVKMIQSDDFLADPVIPLEDVLSDSELEIFKLMLSAGGAMSRYEINQSKSANFSDAMLAMNLDNSPIFSRLDTGVFALRGRQLNIASIQRAMESVRGSLGKSADIIDGVVSFNLTLSEYHVRNKFFEVPANVVSYLVDGEYAVDEFNTPARASMTYRRIYQLIQKMIKMGYGAGDTVTIQILPNEKRIRILMKAE